MGSHDEYGTPITGRQAEALQFIRDTFERRGCPPTIREIGKALGISSTNGVRYFLGVLEEKGLISRSPRVSRGIRLTERTRDGDAVPRFRPGARAGVAAIPLVGQIAAGGPLLAEQQIEEILQLDSSLFPHDEGTFALRVKGDSMVNAGILEGDLVVVRPDPKPVNGTIVVAYWNDEATVKRYVRRGRSIVLCPENDAYVEIVIEPHQEDFRILGKVVGVLRRC